MNRIECYLAHTENVKNQPKAKYFVIFEKTSYPICKYHHDLLVPNTSCKMLSYEDGYKEWLCQEVLSE